MKNFMFPAVFVEDETGVGVVFPDLPGCVTQNDNYELAFKDAGEALNFHLSCMIEDGEEIPNPSRLRSIKLNEGEALALIETQI